MSTRRILMSIAVALIAAGTIFASPAGSYNPVSSGARLDPGMIAMGGGGVSDPDGLFEVNPANVGASGLQLNTPYIIFSLNSPRHRVMPLLNRDMVTFLGTVPAGNSHIYEMQAGMDFQMKHGGALVRVERNLYSSAPENGSGTDADLFIQNNLLLGGAAGGKLQFTKKMSLSLGAYFGIETSIWSGGAPVRGLMKSINSSTVEPFLYTAIPMFTGFSIPVNFGASFDYDSWFNVGLTVRNDSIFEFGLSHYDCFKDFQTKMGENFLDYFAGDCSFNWKDWTMDIGITGYHEWPKYYWPKKFGFKATFEIIDITGLCLQPEDWIGHIAVGLEGTSQGISLRCGFNRGPAVGIGLDMIAARFDATIRKVMFPEPGTKPYSQAVARVSLGW